MNSKFQITIYFVSIVLGINSCSLLDPASNLNNLQQPTNEIIVKSIDFNIQKTSTSSDWIYCKIQEVELNKYSNVDSIIFVPNMRSQFTNEHCIVEVYNFNTNQVVLNSHVESTVRYTLHFGRSANMISTFPKEKTLIGLRFRSSKEGHYIEIGIGTRILIYSH